MRALILGFFSTIGDTEVLAVVRGWLDAIGVGYDVAPYASDVRTAMPGSLDPLHADPRQYTHLFVVCGPCWPGLFSSRGIDLKRFSHCTSIGINLTMIEPLAAWNPFDVLLERDSLDTVRPDLAFLAPPRRATLAGLCLIASQEEYGARQRHELAETRLRALIDRHSLTTVDVDTRWPATRNQAGIRRAADVDTILARVDVVLTTRLHGLVFALRNEIPVIAIDPIGGGDKVTRQGRIVDWPHVLLAEEATDERLDRALASCLLAEAKDLARECSRRARETVRALEPALSEALGASARRLEMLPAAPPRKKSRFWRARQP